MGHRHLAVSNAVNHVADDGENGVDGGRANLLQEQRASVVWRRAVIQRVQQGRLGGAIPVEIIDIEVAGEAIGGVIDPQIAVAWIRIVDARTEIPLDRGRFTLRPDLAHGADIAGPALVANTHDAEQGDVAVLEGILGARRGHRYREIAVSSWRGTCREIEIDELAGIKLFR